MVEIGPEETGFAFERLKVPENKDGLPEELKEKFAQFPILPSGNWQEDQLSFHLRWEGGYSKHLNPDIAKAVRKEYLREDKGWRKAIAAKREQLNRLKELPTIEERKNARKKIMPFPGVVMTFEGIHIKDDRVVINTRVGNYAEIHPGFGISSSSFTSLFPGHEKDLWKVARGMGVLIITETSDDYHIFGQRAANVMGAGFIGTLGITPNISDEQMKSYVRQAGNRKSLDIPGSWLFNLIKEDISEHNELNLETMKDPDSAFKDIRLIGAIPDPRSGWMILVIFCKLNVGSAEIESLYSASPDHEYQNFIFAKNNPQSLAAIFSRNVYPALYGGYHAYFKLIHPEVL